MQTIPHARPSLYELASRLDGPFPACDPDFDAVYDDLEREFAHERLFPDANEGGAYA